MFKQARSRLRATVFACAAALGPGAFASTPVAVSRHCITSGRPAEDSITGWERESYPIGNGFKGLCARGRLVVDCEWKDGKPVAVTVRAPEGAKPDVRFAGKPVAYKIAR